MLTKAYIALFLCIFLLSCPYVKAAAASDDDDDDDYSRGGMNSPASGEKTTATSASSVAAKSDDDAVADDDDDEKDKAPQVEDVTFSSTEIDSVLLDIVWCGEHKEDVIVLTEKGTIYRSANSGMEWDSLRRVFAKTAKKIVADEEPGDVNKILQSPVDKNLMLFLGSEGINWYTEDCGATIKAMNTGRNVKEFQFHPMERQWVLASAFTSCDDFDDGEPCKIYKELYLSKDLGENWTFLADYIIQFSWAVQDYSFILNIPIERIVIAHDLNKKGNQKTVGWSEKAEIAYSDDFFKTKTTVVHRGNKFLITKNYFFAVQVDDEDIQDVRLLIGNPRHSKYELENIELPTKSKKKSRLLEHSYTILDTSEGQVFLHINHEGEKSKSGNIYISDSTGMRYSMSLRGNVRNLDGQCDFEKVAGLEGIYLANIYDPAILKKLKNDDASSNGIAVERDTSKPKGTNKAYQTTAVEGKSDSKRSQDLENYKQTRISFDKGAIWEPLDAPKFEANGTKVECEDPKSCFLHLHSISNSKFGPFYSTDNSLGIVLSTGNIGKYLSNKEDEVNTYLSRDGGLTWYEIKKGSHIYEIGDHGAIIVVAPDQVASKYVFYTWNEGLSWSKVKISDEPVQITNIIIEPTNTAEKFVLYGRTSANSKTHKESKGVLISIDFTSLHERNCELPDKPNDASSDYETWSPNGHISDHCLMGHQTTYVRRKREAQCFNREEFDRWYSYQNCECTEEDWECDLGYERKNGGEGACVLSAGEDEPTYAPPEYCPDYYTVTKGYRKVAGNTCRGGVDHEGITLPCPGKVLSKQNLVVILALVFAGLGVWIISKNGGVDRAKDLIKGVSRSAAHQVKRAADKTGFQVLGQDEGHHDDDDDELDNNIRFDDHEDSAMPLDNIGDSSEQQRGKRMTERRGLETAFKSIPAINRPGQNAQDNDDDDISGFDPRH